MRTPPCKILFIVGGWEGHKPQITASRLAEALGNRGIEAQIVTSLQVLNDQNLINHFSVISPCWTMGELSRAQTQVLSNAVRNGVGLAGIHGGMGDAFRGNLEYEWMVGGHFVGHPYVGEYCVKICDFSSPITKGLPESFMYRSEKYYLLVEPGIRVLADTEYEFEGITRRMPVAWTKSWGKGRVFYSALGHQPEEFDEFPVSLELTLRGFQWAAGVLDATAD